MTCDLLGDSVFISITNSVDEDGGLLMDGWVEYQGEKWHPVLIRDQRSGKRGFDVNYSGKWGKNEDVGRRKLDIGEFLQALAMNAIPNDASVRCKRLNDGQRNGRHIQQLEMSDRLGALVLRIRA